VPAASGSSRPCRFSKPICRCSGAVSIASSTADVPQSVAFADLFSEAYQARFTEQQIHFRFQNALCCFEQRQCCCALQALLLL
jgi:hypothetical protein